MSLYSNEEVCKGCPHVKIKAVLKQHRETNPGVKIVKITTTRYYEINEGNCVEELMEEWFEKKNISHHHAHREGSLLIQHFNGDAVIIV